MKNNVEKSRSFRPSPGNLHKQTLNQKLNGLITNNKNIVGLLIFVVVFAVFCSNRNFIIASDTKGVTASASCISQGFGLTLNKHLNYQGNQEMYGYWAKRLPDGRVVSIYPIAASLTAAPLYWVAYKLGYSTSVTDEGLLAKWVACFMLSLACYCCWRTMYHIFDPLTALICSILLGIGTPFYSTLSQSLWIQTPAIMCQAISLTLCVPWLFKKNDNSGNFIINPLQLIAAGFIASWATACRPNFVIWSGLLAVAAIVILHARSIYYIAGALMAGVAFIILNKITYGNLLGAYVSKQDEVGFGFSLTNSLMAAAGLLVSPGRGIFLFCPWTLLSVVGAVMVLKQRKVIKARGYIVLIIYTILTLIMLANFGQWWGGWSNGPRLQSDFLVPAIILCGFPASWLLARSYGFILIGTLAVPAIYLQNHTARMQGYYWEQFAGNSMEEVVSKLWYWDVGNLQWIVSQGEIERELVKEDRSPLIKSGGSLNSREEDFARYVKNSFFPYPGRPGILGTRSEIANLVFRFENETTQPLTLSGSCFDLGKWGSQNQVEVFINDRKLGVIDKITGSAPKPFTFSIPQSWVGEKPYDTLKILQKYPATDGGAGAYALFSELRIEQ